MYNTAEIEPIVVGIQAKGPLSKEEAERANNHLLGLQSDEAADE
ncbi:hypothetical protein [Paenibacillus sp. GM2]|nr:hypothetical protein [Paenibacillus sp. GM2]